MEKRMGDLRVDESAEIVGCESSDARYRGRLLAMGLTKGTAFRLTKNAPLGDPAEIEARGFNLSLRRAETAVAPTGAVLFACSCQRET